MVHTVSTEATLPMVSLTAEDSLKMPAPTGVKVTRPATELADNTAATAGTILMAAANAAPTDVTVGLGPGAVTLMSVNVLP